MYHQRILLERNNTKTNISVATVTVHYTVIVATEIFVLCMNFNISNSKTLWRMHIVIRAGGGGGGGGVRLGLNFVTS